MSLSIAPSDCEWGDGNLATALIETIAARRPTSPAVIQAGRTICYGELRQEIRRLASALQQVCGPGDRVLLVLPESPDFIIAFFAVATIGAVAVLVNPLSSPQDAAFYVSDSTPRVIILSALQKEEFCKVVRKRDCLFVMAGSPSSCTSGGEVPWQNFVGRSSRDVIPFAASRNDAAVILYTSGTTGRQKGVLHSHGSFIAASQNIGHSVFGYAEGDRTLCTARHIGAFGLGFGICFPLSSGGTILCRPNEFSIHTAIAYLETCRPSIVVGVPGFFAALLKASRAVPVDLSSVRMLISAGEPLPLRLYDGVRDRFGLSIIDGLGSTEMLTHFVGNYPGESVRGSTGRCLPGSEVSLRSDEGQAVAPFEKGTLWVRGATEFLGYWNRPELTERIRQDGWIVTGDRFYRDDQDCFHYIGRGDDMVKIGGLWVDPGDIERVLCANPIVDAAAVVVREDLHGSRRLIAYVVLAAGARLTPPEILKSVAANLPLNMLPSAVVILSEFPVLASGKIDRRALPDPSWVGERPDEPTESYGRQSRKKVTSKDI